MTQGVHAVDRPRSRRRRWLVLLGVPAGLLALAVAAYALFFAQAKINGSAQSGTYGAQFATAGINAGASTTPANCPSVSVDGAGVLQISGGSMMPGDVCRIQTGVIVTGIGNFAGLGGAALSNGWHLAVADRACGDTMSTGSPVVVSLDLSRDASAQADGSTVSLAGLSVLVSPSSQGIAATNGCKLSL